MLFFAPLFWPFWTPWGDDNRFLDDGEGNVFFNQNNFNFTGPLIIGSAVVFWLYWQLSGRSGSSDRRSKAHRKSWPRSSTSSVSSADPPVIDRATPDLSLLLDRVPGWAGQARVVGSLGGGITNRNILVAVDGERFVLRLAGKDTELLEIRRRDEFDAARRAAALAGGPEVVAFLEPEGYLVTRFLDASPVTTDELTGPDLLPQVADLLRRFHGTGALAGDFDAFRVPHLHLAAAQGRGVPEPAWFGRAADVAGRIESAFLADPEPRVPCHNDLLTANFLRDPDDHLWLLDWEYAGNNDRYFDLGNFAVNNELDPSAEDHLLGLYFGSPSPRRRARLRLMKVMSDFREAMWAVVQQGISTLAFDYVTYAAVHAERMLVNASESAFDGLLTAATTPDRKPR